MRFNLYPHQSIVEIILTDNWIEVEREALYEYTQITINLSNYTYTVRQLWHSHIYNII